MITINFTLVIQIVLFLLIMWVLNKLLFQPVLSVLDERRERIDGGRARAKELDEQTRSKIEQCEAALRDARIQGTAERTEIRAKGAQDAQEILATARKEADGIVSEIRERLTKEQDDARAALQTQVDSLSREVAGKVLGRQVA